MLTKKKTLLIDGSVIIYRVSAALEEATEWEHDVWTLHTDYNLAKQTLENTIKHFFIKLNCSRIVIALDDKDNFRKTLYPEYKSNRKKIRKPITVKPLKEYLQKEYECVSYPGLEGDDVLGILATSEEYKDNCIILSSDKDLRTVPGMHHFIHDGSTELVDEATANYNFMYQTLIGDRTDNFPGVPGVGGVKAQRVLANKNGLNEMWPAVVAEYKRAKLDEEEALTQARLARILRASDWDIKNKKPILWQLQQEK
jgi:DNA polymerase-1